MPLTLAACGLANAADLPPPPVYKSLPAPVAYTWTGCYVGGGAGYGWWTQDSFVQLAGGAPVTASITNGGKGWFGQGQGGCDYQFNAPHLFNIPLVVGAFGDYEGGSIRGTSDFPGFVGTETETAAWAAGARIGALVAPRVLTYFDGGWTQAHFGSVGYNFSFAGGGPSGVSLSAQTYNWLVPRRRFRIFTRLAADLRAVPENRIPLLAVCRGQRPDHRRCRWGPYYRCHAQLTEGDRDDFDGVGVAL